MSLQRALGKQERVVKRFVLQKIIAVPEWKTLSKEPSEKARGSSCHWAD